MKEPEQDAVADLYREFLDQRNSGSAPSITEFLSRCPQEHREELREAIDFLREAKTEEKAPLRKFGDFEIVREIGRGGMGVVYEARQISMQRPVALKLLSPWAAQEPAARARLLAEALALAKVRHPNIVSVLATGEEQETPYLAMELVSGNTLSEVLEQAAREQRPVPISQILRWVWRIACGLEAANAAGVIHRDVKPSNIRITHDGRAILVDFGLARNESANALTKTGSFQGSPFYASPEQVAAKRGKIDARTDVYSLGVTLYECVTGAVPFQGETTEQILQQILLREPAPPREKNRGISRDLETVILKAIEKSPDRRYASAAAFAADLEALLEMRPITARPSGAATRAMKWAARNPGAASAVGALALGALAVVAVWQGQHLVREQERISNLNEARRALEDNRFSDAISAVDKAIGLAPGKSDSQQMRQAILERQREHQCKEELANARAHLQEYLSLREQCRRDLGAVETFRFKLSTKALSQEEMAGGEALELRLGKEQKDRDHHQRAVESALAAAGRYNPANPEIASLRAEFSMHEWREAIRNVDSASEKHFRSLVEENDATGLYREELLGLGEIALEILPDGAELHLFRIEELAQIRETGERRLVPVPVQEDPLPVEVGSFALRVVQALGSFRAGDLLFQVGGRSAAEFWNSGEALTASNRCHVYRDGVRLLLPAEPGLACRPTVAPLLASEANRLRASTVSLKSMAPGSYLVRARKDGFQEQRLAFELPRLGKVGKRAQLAPAIAAPRGFVFVPGGHAYAGKAGARAEADVGPFWIQELEVSGTEYLEFLNAPETLQQIDASAAPILYPRNSRDPVLRPLPDHGKSLWLRKADGKFEIPPEYAGVPVTGVSYQDAEAYARWRNEEAERKGEPWRFSLPHRNEWYFAGSGADGREFPFGNHFDQRWTANSLSTGAAQPFRSLRFPHDESIFGVYDLGGNLAEFVLDLDASGQTTVFLAGGSWIIPGATLTNALPISVESYAAPYNFGGFRLVARSTK